MEKGNAAQFKNKTLDEIDIDMEHIDEEKEIEESHTRINEGWNFGFTFVAKLWICILY